MRLDVCERYRFFVTKLALLVGQQVQRQQSRDVAVGRDICQVNHGAAVVETQHPVRDVGLADSNAVGAHQSVERIEVAGGIQVRIWSAPVVSNSLTRTRSPNRRASHIIRPRGVAFSGWLSTQSTASSPTHRVRHAARSVSLLTACSRSARALASATRSRAHSSMTPSRVEMSCFRVLMPVSRPPSAAMPVSMPSSGTSR